MNIPTYVDETHKILWPFFENWCANNGIEKNPVDMEVWWNCFIAGATSLYLNLKKNGDLE